MDAKCARRPPAAKLSVRAIFDLYIKSGNGINYLFCLRMHKSRKNYTFFFLAHTKKYLCVCAISRKEIRTLKIVLFAHKHCVNKYLFSTLTPT